MEKSIGTARTARGILLLRSFSGPLAAISVSFLVLSGCWTTTSSEPEVDPIALAGAIRDLGLDQLRQGNYSMAIRKLQRAELKNPEDPLVYYGLGEAFRRKGLLAEAEVNLLKSLELSPDPHAQSYQLAVLTLSVLYIQQERYEEAVVLCQVLIDDPTYERPWTALTNRGWAQYKSEQFEAARLSYQEALGYRSTYAVAHFNLGILEQEQGRWLDAVRQLDLAAKSREMSSEARSEAYFRLGEIYMTLGRKDEAIEKFGLAIEKAPDGEWAEKSRSRLEVLL